MKKANLNKKYKKLQTRYNYPNPNSLNIKFKKNFIELQETVKQLQLSLFQEKEHSRQLANGLEEEKIKTFRLEMEVLELNKIIQQLQQSQDHH